MYIMSSVTDLLSQTQSSIINTGNELHVSCNIYLTISIMIRNALDIALKSYELSHALSVDQLFLDNSSFLFCRLCVDNTKRQKGRLFAH